LNRISRLLLAQYEGAAISRIEFEPEHPEAAIARLVLGAVRGQRCAA
jgi:hypothetical protein